MNRLHTQSFANGITVHASERDGSVNVRPMGRRSVLTGLAAASLACRIGNLVAQDQSGSGQGLLARLQQAKKVRGNPTGRSRAWKDFSTSSRDLRLLIAIDVVLGFPDRVARQPERYAMPSEASLTKGGIGGTKSTLG